jgi:trans-AT polyketide synthase/acyltransferase/oxidoreductase domain-containing protein
MQIQTAFMFPGQGAQHPGMGRALLPRHREPVQLAEDILGYRLATLCTGEDGRLNATEFTQPAMFVVNHLHLLEQLQMEPAPAFVLGHSLGEYNALVAAGVLDFADALRVVRERGWLMSRERTGGMAAVMKLELEQLRNVLARHELGAAVDIANINSREQIVIAAPRAALDGLVTPLQMAGGFVVPLNVSGGFHSRLMASASAELARLLAPMQLGAPQIPVVSNVSGRLHEVNQIKARLCEHLTAPVQWRDSVEYLLNANVRNFREVGVGATLSGLLRYIVRDWETSRRAT